MLPGLEARCGFSRRAGAVGGYSGRHARMPMSESRRIIAGRPRAWSWNR